MASLSTSTIEKEATFLLDFWFSSRSSTRMGISKGNLFRELPSFVIKGVTNGVTQGFLK